MTLTSAAAEVAASSVRLGDRVVGGGAPAMVVAEIGINHNGDLGLCLEMITAAAGAGAEAVKFQKRTLEVVYPPEELARPRASVFGTTNGDLKRGLEFGFEEYRVIAGHCAALGMAWSVSCWDEASVDFIEAFAPPFLKIASASLTDDALLARHRATGIPLVVSTGMSSLAEIDHAVDVLGTRDLVLLACTSTYPASVDELNVRAVATLAARYGVPVGYSGHERELTPAVAAVALGACVVERHLTLDRELWGSDQAASLLPGELARTVAEIRTVERALGDGVVRVYDSEVPVRAKLRRVG